MVCVVSLLVGIGVGVIYALLGVKSPAPPVVALFGLLGIVAGEQGVPWAKRLLADRSVSAPASHSPGQQTEPRRNPLLLENPQHDHPSHLEDPQRSQARDHA